MKKKLLHLVLMLTSGSVFAQSGTFDPDFGSGSLYQVLSSASNLKIISTGNEDAMINMNVSISFPGPPYGQADGSFGSLSNDPVSGNLTTSAIHTLGFSDQYHEIMDFERTSNGKVAIAGYKRLDYNTWNKAAFVGLVDPTNGNLVSTFNSGNFVTLQSSGTYEIHQLEVQSDDKIVVAGFESLNNFFVRRYNTDGTLDDTFGNSAFSGASFFSVYDAAQMRVRDLKVTSDGKILVAGYDMETGAYSHGFVARFNADGTNDNTFGTNGIAFVDFDYTAGHNIIHSIDVMANGEILVAGTYQPSGDQAALLKLTSSGVVASDFPLFSYGSYSGFNKVMVLANGKILVGGSSPAASGTGTDGLFMLFNADGTTENSFGGNNNGKAFFAGGLYYGNWVEDFDVQPDGKVIFVAGTTAPYEARTLAGRMLMSSSSANLEEAQTDLIRVFPNPANAVLNIQNSGFTTAVISTLNGVILSTLELNGETTIDVSTYSPGVYFILTAEGQTVKFIKE
jgi:uncharacterized delta-60 repeat protein